MRLNAFIPGIIFFIFTTVLLVLPGNELPKSDLFDIPYFDKFVHTGLFFLLSVMFYFPINSINTTVLNKQGWIVRITMYALAYGITMEFVQKYIVPHRSFDVVDILFDGLGCLIAAIFCLQLIPKK